MHRNIILPIVLFLLTVMLTVVFAGPFDSGWREWSQPNGVKFTARLWGDEFQWWMRTDDGYSTIKGNAGYFYYAVLDTVGEFTPSDKKVGIDTPPTESYQLERSPERTAEIEDLIEDFNIRVSQNAERYAAKRAASPDGIVTEKLGVILVDFTPSKRYRPSNYPDGIPKSKYDNLFFSTGTWYGEKGNSPHPDGDALFGSFREYYQQQSLNKLEIEGAGSDDLSVLNPDSAGSIYPLWVILDTSRTYYHKHGAGIFHKDVINKFADMVSNYSIDTTGITKWSIFYAGEQPVDSFLRSGLIPAAFPGVIPDPTYPNFTDYFVMSEVWVSFDDPAGSKGFNHIGQQIHEFGHLLGASDEYVDGDPYPADPYYWDVMSLGIYNGPVGNLADGACPAGFSPPYRSLFWDWVTLTTIVDTTNLKIHYNYMNPLYYKIDIPGSDEYFIIENRLRDGFDLCTPIPDTSGYNPSAVDPNGAIGGLLIWHVDSSQFINDNESDMVELEFANNDPYTYEFFPPEGFYSYYGHPFPYGSNNQNFNDGTSPAANKRDGSLSGVAINNIQWNDVDSSITIGEIVNDFSLNVIKNDTTWEDIVTISTTTVIDSGVTLTINAGTIINMNVPINPSDRHKIIFLANSHFNPLGTAEEPITFQSANTEPEAGDWKGVNFQFNDFDTVQLNLSHIIIRDSEEGFTFYVNGLGLIFPPSEFRFDSIQFINNTRSMILKNGQLIIPFDISNCYFEDSPFDIIEPFLATRIDTLTLKNNIFKSCETGIKIIDNLYPISFPIIKPIIDGNLFINNLIGIFLDVKIPLETLVRNNIFKDNETGISFVNNDIPLLPKIKYNGFWSDEGPITGFTGDSAVIADPMFVYEEAGNYQLTWNSQMIDAGDPDYDEDSLKYYEDPDDQDPDGTRMDIGPSFIYYDQHPVSLFINHIASFNLVGLPIANDSVYYLDIYSNAIPNTLQRWDGTYIADSILVPGEGYWLQFYNAGTDTIDGTELTALRVELKSGWNLFSGLSTDYPINSIIDPKEIIVPGSINGYNGSYYYAETLEPGKGYWIRAFQDGIITLYQYYVQTGGTQFVNLMESANWIDFTNASGNKTTLYFGITVPENEQLSYSMPPLPPDSLLDSTALDARFTGDWEYTDSTAQIEITTDSYPLTIEYGIVNGDTGDWNLSNFGLPKSVSGFDDNLTAMNHTLKKKGKIVINEPVKSIMLNKVSNENIPNKFALRQNYPNPFNSSTTIKYDLPEKTKVKLVIYDILGRKVKVLIDKTEEPGFRTLVWDGTNDYGVSIASGLYFYRIETEKFKKTKKLLIIK